MTSANRSHLSVVGVSLLRLGHQSTDPLLIRSSPILPCSFDTTMTMSLLLRSILKPRPKAISTLYMASPRLECRPAAISASYTVLKRLN